MSTLLLFAGPSWPEVGHPYGGHTGCGGRLVWTWVPPQDAAPRSCGIATCGRCGIDECAWPDRYDALTVAQADAAVVAVDEELEDEEPSIPAEVEALQVAKQWARLQGGATTPRERSNLIDAWWASDEYRELGGDEVGGMLTSALARAMRAA